MSGSPPVAFVVFRADGFIGVEIDANDQMTVAETRTFAKELLKLADKAALQKTRKFPVEERRGLVRRMRDERAGVKPRRTR